MVLTLLLFLGACLLAFAVVVLRPVLASAHCDTMDGPAAQDGRLALESGNPNHALKWAGPEYEAELREIFAQAQGARRQGREAREVADRWFLENLVRIHRAGEGAPSGDSNHRVPPGLGRRSADQGPLRIQVHLVAQPQQGESARRRAAAGAAGPPRCR